MKRIVSLKTIVIFAFIVANIVQPFIGAVAYAATESQDMPYTITGYVNDCGIMQGGATDGQSLYYACSKRQGIRIVKTSLDGKEIARSPLLSHSQLGHANDITYNSKTKQLVVSSWESGKSEDKVRLVNPSTFAIEGSMTTSDRKSTSNICYNATTDQYLIGGRIYDSKLNFQKRIYTASQIDSDLGLAASDDNDGEEIPGKILNQGIECDASRIYVMRVIFDENGYNMIGVYDWSGNNVAIYKINLNDEGENLSLIGNTIYMGINEGGMSKGGESDNDYIIQLNLSGGASSQSCSTSLSAEEKERDATWNNEFWDKTNKCVCSQGSSSGMSGNTNFKKIVTYLAAKGLGNTAIAGIMANFNSESANYSAFRIQGQNSSQEGDVPSNGGYGIAQFTPTTKIGKVLKEDARTSKFYETYYTRKYGGLPDETTGVPAGVPVEVNDAFLGVELDFIYKGELKTTTADGRLAKLEKAGVGYINGKDTIFDALQKTQDKEGGEKDAAKIFMILYERPASTMDATWNIDAINARGTMATELLADVQSAMGVSGNSAAACSQTSGATGDFAATVKAFAWEDGRRVSEQKPDYTAALKGRYKGGNGGNDCGAFVSTLMVKSGFEPDYPGTSTDGGTGNGGQIAWLNKNWETLYEVGKVDTAKLRAGDVAIRPGHVFVWIGDVEGFVSKSAEAALGSNTAPTAIEKGNTYSEPSQYTWYRKKI